MIHFQYAVVYPVSKGKFVNVVAIVREEPEDAVWEGPWKVDVSQREFLDVYAGWDEEVQALIRVGPVPCNPAPNLPIR